METLVLGHIQILELLANITIWCLFLRKISSLTIILFRLICIMNSEIQAQLNLEAMIHLPLALILIIKRYSWWIQLKQLSGPFLLTKLWSKTHPVIHSLFKLVIWTLIFCLILLFHTSTSELKCGNNLQTSSTLSDPNWNFHAILQIAFVLHSRRVNHLIFQRENNLSE